MDGPVVGVEVTDFEVVGNLKRQRDHQSEAAESSAATELQGQESFGQSLAGTNRIQSEGNHGHMRRNKFARVDTNATSSVSNVRGFGVSTGGGSSSFFTEGYSEMSRLNSSLRRPDVFGTIGSVANPEQNVGNWNIQDSRYFQFPNRSRKEDSDDDMDGDGYVSRSRSDPSSSLNDQVPTDQPSSSEDGTSESHRFVLSSGRESAYTGELL